LKSELAYIFSTVAERWIPISVADIHDFQATRKVLGYDIATGLVENWLVHAGIGRA